MSGRIKVEGIEHGDRVLLTGASWRMAKFHPDEIYEVDDVSFHRPVIYADGGTGKVIEWYIIDPVEGGDFSVTKVGA